MFWRKKFVAVNQVPDDYEFSKPYEITVSYKKDRYSDCNWEAYTDGYIYLSDGRTREEATILAQNTVYRWDLEKKEKAANPSETFVIPPIRKFDSNE